MENINLEVLKSIFSKARIMPYAENGDATDTILAKYHSNIILSEAMIPTLHYLEICLRNRIDQILKKYHKANWLISPPNSLMISAQDLKKIEDVIFKLKRENRRDPMHDEIVAQMTFGFWAAFFHKKYDPSIWHRKDTFKIIFPHLPRAQRKRSYIEIRILKIKEMRNRIAHHEPVWNRGASIYEAHTMCHELIGAMSQEAAQILTTIDRFPAVYQKVSNYITG